MSIIKSSCSFILKPLVYIFNKSLQQGAVPSELKLAKVIPLYKSGDKDSVANYRPISLLTSFSKIFEQVIYNRLTNFINKYDIICREQFGFRKKHGPNMALDVLVNRKVNANEERQSVVGVFLDLSKAFDTLDHDILLDKLYNYRIRGQLLLWLGSYLKNRKQRVRYH